ncbi:MAG: hypothetical protein ABIP51_20420 [Bacteroidia bacterium]
METTKENNPTPPVGGSIPEWVMHLLTGLGTMGAEYMMFIKPLQEKMELQSRLITEQGKRIDELEDLMQNRRKPKRYMQSQSEEEDEDNEEEDKDLFQVRRKPTPVTKYNKNVRIKL